VAKNECATGRKKLKKEARGDFVTRNQNKSASIEHPCIRISSNAGNENSYVFDAFVPLGRGEKPQGKK
jgi:hypothetical protein